MRVKILVLAIIWLFSHLSLYAQRKEVVITGEIVSDNNEEIDGYNVYVLSYADSTMLASGLFFDKHFELAVKGEFPFIVNIRSFVFADTTFCVSETSQLNLGEIRLTNPILLNEVMVTGTLKHRKSDLETIIITDSLREGVTSAAMLLGRLKGIKNDWMTESISIGVESNVLILVNGREMPSNYALSLKPERIKKVEIIRHPTGKYSGYPVVLNLELYEEYVGWDIAPKFSGMMSLKNKHTNREIFSIDGTWSRDRWNVYGSLACNLKKEYQVSEYKKVYDNAYFELSSPIDLSSPNKEIGQNRGSIYLGSDYRIANNQSLHLQMQASINDMTSESLFDIKSGVLKELLSTTNSSKNNYHSENYAVDFSYRGELSKRWKLDFSLLYNHYRIDEERMYRQGDEHLFERNYEGAKNYLRPYIGVIFELSPKWTLLMDNSLTWRNFTNYEKGGNREMYKSEDLSNLLNANIKFNPSRYFDLSLGGSWITIKDKHYDRSRVSSSLIPYLKLYWQPIKWIDFNLNYFNTIDNPTLDQLSPLRWQVDKMMFHEGNPYLKPRVMHYIEGQIELNKLFKVTLMHKISRNDITSHYQKREGSIIESLTNSEYRHSYVGVEGDWNLGKGFSLAILLNYQWYKRYKLITEMQKGYTYTIDTQLTYSLPRIDLTILTSFYLRKDWIPLLKGREYMQEEVFMLGVNKSFWDDKLSATFAFAMPTNILPKRIFQQIEIPEYRSITYNDSRLNSYVISLNLRMRIGSNRNSKHQIQRLPIEQEK